MGRKAGLILMALVLLGMAGFVSAHSINVNGAPNDWTGDSSAISENNYGTSNGEWIWKDATEDVRTDLGDPGDTDITEVRVTSDANYLYILVKFRDITKVGSYLEDNSEPFSQSDRGLALIITIDTTQDSNGQVWLPENVKTKVSSNAAWERAVFITAANNGWNYNDKILKGNYNEFRIYDPNWNRVGTDKSEAVISADNDVIEIGLHKDDLGINDLSSTTIRITVSTAVYDWGDQKPVDLSNSDLIDAMTTTNTWDEVKDGTLDYYADVHISQVPFFSSLAVALAVVFGAVIIFRRR